MLGHLNVINNRQNPDDLRRLSSRANYRGYSAYSKDRPRHLLPAEKVIPLLRERHGEKRVRWGGAEREREREREEGGGGRERERE
jgi:hypothetical protein